MRFHKEITFPGDVEEVYALLADEGFRREVAERAGSTSVEVSERETSDGLVATVDSRQPSDGLPSAAQRVIGRELHVRQTETWRDHTHADLHVEMPGKPGHIRGTVTLEQRGEQTVQVVEADAKANVPLVGSKVEQVICRALGHVLKLQGTVAAERLGGASEPAGA